MLAIIKLSCQIVDRRFVKSLCVALCFHILSSVSGVVLASVYCKHISVFRFVPVTTCIFLENPLTPSSGGKSWFLATLNFMILVFCSFIFRSFLAVNLSRLSSCTCIVLFSAGKTCPVLSSCVKGLILSTGSGIEIEGVQPWNCRS